jgi:hypothetical protein
MEEKGEEVEDNGNSLDSHFIILKRMQEMVEVPGPSSKRQEVVRSIIEAENR